MQDREVSWPEAPELAIVDGGKGLEATMRPSTAVQRRSVHKLRNLIALAPEKPHEGFTRRIETRGALPCADTACMMFRALLASGQIALRKVHEWRKLPPNTLDIST